MIRATCFFILLLITIPAIAQAPPSPPVVVAFGDNKAWYVYKENMLYVIGKTNDKIVVPNGFVTDYASVPKIMWLFGLSPHEQYSRAAIIHDYLYWSQGCTRAQADQLMFIAMKESKVGWLGRWLVYLAVNLFGESAWTNNANEQQAGLPRILPNEYQKYQRLDYPNISWEDFQKVLIMAGIKDSKFEQNPSYCKYGNSKEVPE